ncbi:hypothetical protein LPA44_04055 [Halobacterium sp. KA-4]|uniref:hypothetical protein n=1 Tax=Halobacterium sp. KA-4 TaxID=2896367 RepID=UPI001E4663DD|nr:hypothetical protein [Halobacterium sp. KA-4]MCD2199072.1 hypothetical protein [Halobacterium sp. KA-4]
MSDDDREAFARASNVLDREEMAEHVESKPHIKETANCGPGLQVVQNEAATDKNSFTDLVEKYGWYVAVYENRTPNDHLVLMPLPEVEQR